MDDHHSVAVIDMTMIFQVIFEKKLEKLISFIGLWQVMDHASFAVVVHQ
jgi:hypothetical protein